MVLLMGRTWLEFGKKRLRRTSFLGTVILLSLVFVTTIGCFSSSSSMPRSVFGPDMTTDLVVYLNADVTNDEINSFWENIIADTDEKGSHLLPGIGFAGRTRSVQDHPAIAIRFFPDITESERDLIMSRINSSPLVFKVLENVAPSEVESLD